MSFTHKIRAGVLRGGPSPEYEVSLQTGGSILSNLPDEYEPVDIFISKDGVWHEKGLEKNPEKILNRIDVAINGLHGKYGEDGEVQKILEHFGVPYTGSNPLSSAMAMNKLATKKIYFNHLLKTPFSVSIPLEKLSRNTIRDAYYRVPMPFVVKPATSGSSIGVFSAHSLPDLEEAVVAASVYSPTVIIEEMIQGKEATCGVIDDFRGKEHYPLIPIEVRHGKDVFDYNSKHSSKSAQQVCPGNFTSEQSKMIEEMAIEAHKALGLRHYSRSDFIVHPKRGIFILETNSLPSLSEHSLIPKSLHSIGSNIKEFLSHILNKALGKK